MSSSEGYRQACNQLLTTVYKQYWPVPAWNTYIHDAARNSSNLERPAAKPRQSSSSVTKHAKSNSGQKKKSMAAVPLETEWSVSKYGSATSFAKLDTATLDRLGWAQADLQGTDKQSRNHKHLTNDFKTSLTKADYRRLSDQVRDVSSEFSRVFTPAANFQKSYQVDGTTTIPWKRNASHIYRSQLASSLRVFQKKLREPLEIEEPVETRVLKSRPFSSRNAQSRPTSSVSNRRFDKINYRPKSVPVSSYRRTRPSPVTNLDPVDFDTLDPNVLSQLIVEGRPTLSNGDAAPSLESLSSKESLSVNNTHRLQCHRAEHGDWTGSTSGVESSLTDDSDSSDDDEAGMGEEPEVDTHLSVPEISLRPEKWDEIYSPPIRNDRIRFDFEAANTFMPDYEFKGPFPDACYRIDFRTLNTQKNVLYSLPSEVAEDRMLVAMMTRLGDIEKLEAETIDAERRRKERQKQNVSRSRSSKSPSPMLNGSSKDRNCCSDCLQVACIGNCPCKKASNKCGLGHSIVYDEINFDIRPRQTRSGTHSAKTTEGTCKHQSCRSCKVIHTAKYINANNIIQGRPRSSNSTYSRGQGCSKPKDLRPVNHGTFNPSVAQQFEKLGIKTNRPQTYKTAFRSKGRNGLLPGKSYFSQRKDSLTKPEVKQKLTNMAGKKTKTQCSGRRPKTAA